jgi:hypothetical protein
MNKTKIKQDRKQKKFKHIKNTKLSPIKLKTIPVPSGVAILSHVKIRAAAWRLFVICSFALIHSLGVAT